MDARSVARPVLRFGSLALALLGLIGLVSCPIPIDDALLRLVEDDLPPELTISSPVGNSLYGATVHVSGTLRDSAFAVGDGQGQLKSLAFSVPSDATLTQLVSFDASGGWTLSRPDPSFSYDAGTGEFSFEFSTVGLAGGPKVLAFSAADFNDNQSERALTLLEDPSGPHVNLATPTNLSNYDITVNLQGFVTNSLNDPATNDVKLIKWECLQDLARYGKWEAGKPSEGNLSYDTGTTEFTGWFSTIGLSGTIGIRVYADDYAGHRTEVSLQLLDNRPGPAITIETWPSVYSSAVTTSVTVTGRVENADLGQLTYLAYGSTSGSTGGMVSHTPEYLFAPHDIFSFTFNPRALTPGITGLLTVKVQARDTSGKRESEQSVTVTDDPVRPTIVSSSLAANNGTVDITFSEAVYTDNNGTGGLVAGDFSLSFSRNGGSATGASITGVSMLAADTARLTLNITGMPSGQETVSVAARSSEIFDALGNAMLATQTTGALALNDLLPPAISSASMAADNDLDIYFSETVYTNSNGTGALTTGDFLIVFSQNGGTATAASISSVSMPTSSRAHLNLGISGTPSGAETVTVTPAGGSSIYDAAGNAMPGSETTGAQYLNAP